VAPVAEALNVQLTLLADGATHGVLVTVKVAVTFALPPPPPPVVVVPVVVVPVVVVPVVPVVDVVPVVVVPVVPVVVVGPVLSLPPHAAWMRMRIARAIRFRRMNGENGATEELIMASPSCANRRAERSSAVK
jgi:hypothetical protein